MWWLFWDQLNGGMKKTKKIINDEIKNIKTKEEEEEEEEEEEKEKEKEGEEEKEDKFEQNEDG